jgi:membrane protease YdiL (CAAX protease family)
MLTWQQLSLLLAPWLLLVTTYGCFRFLKRRLSITWAYFGGFLFYWLVWCFLLPLALPGPTALIDLFRPVAPFGEPGWLGAFCLIAPPLISLITIFPRELRRANRTIVLISIVLAIVNGALEEVLWRGAYHVVFRDNLWLALIYPSIGFALWHLAPQSIFPFEGAGGRLSLVIAVGFLGLMWAWAANSTGVIVWTIIAHILIDFSALGWPPRRIASPRAGAQ